MGHCAIMLEPNFNDVNTATHKNWINVIWWNNKVNFGTDCVFSQHVFFHNETFQRQEIAGSLTLSQSDPPVDNTKEVEAALARWTALPWVGMSMSGHYEQLAQQTATHKGDI